MRFPLRFFSTWWARACSPLLITLAACSGGGSGDSSTGGSGESPTDVNRPQAQVQGLRCTGVDQNGWCVAPALADGRVIRDVFFIDAQTGWMAGEQGTVLRTDDGGVNWQTLKTPLAAADTVGQVVFADRQRGWIRSENTLPVVWRTVDGGQSWQAIVTPVHTVNHIDLVGSQTVVLKGSTTAGSTRDASAISEDGGDTWRLLSRPLDAVEASGLLWTGVFGQLQTSRDGGRSFVSEPSWGSDFETQSFSVSPEGWGLRIFHIRDALTGAREPAQLWLRKGFQGNWAQAASPPLPTSGYFVISSLASPRGAWVRAQLAPYTHYTLWHSEDAAQSWQTIKLPAGLLTRVGQTAEQLSRGELLASTYTGLLDDLSMWVQAGPEAAEANGLFITTDGGRSWSGNRHPFSGDSRLINAVTRDRSGALLLQQTEGTRWFRSTDQGEKWTALPRALPGGYFERIDQILMLNRDQGLAISSSGQLLHTRNGGQQWEPGPSDPAQRPWQPRFFRNTAGHDRDAPRSQLSLGSDGRVWLIWRGQLFRSSNRGDSWQAVPVTLTGTSDSFLFTPRRLLWQEAGRLVLDVWLDCAGNSRLGFESGCGAAGLATSEDDGRSWTFRSTRWDEYTQLAFFSDRVGVRTFCGNVHRTEDAGATWQRVVGTSDVLSVAELNRTGQTCPRMSSHVLRAGSGPQGPVCVVFPDRTYRSSDTGRTWRTDAPALTPLGTPRFAAGANNVFFVNEQTGWVVDDRGLVSHTQDGGQTWTTQTSGWGKPLISIYASDTQSVWVGGAHNAIAVSRSGGR